MIKEPASFLITLVQPRFWLPMTKKLKIHFYINYPSNKVVILLSHWIVDIFPENVRKLCESEISI